MVCYSPGDWVPVGNWVTALLSAKVVRYRLAAAAGQRLPQAQLSPWQLDPVAHYSPGERILRVVWVMVLQSAKVVRYRLAAVVGPRLDVITSGVGV